MTLLPYWKWQSLSLPLFQLLSVTGSPKRSLELTVLWECLTLSSMSLKLISFFFVYSLANLAAPEVLTMTTNLLCTQANSSPTKVRIDKAMAFPAVMYGCESWTMKNTERWRTDAFELWCWRRLWRVPWTARRSNQSVLKEVSPEYHWKDWYWSWNANTLATWYEELTHLKRPWCWERLKAGGEGDDKGWDGWMASLTWWTWVWASSGSWWWTEKPGRLQSMGLRRVGQDWSNLAAAAAADSAYPTYCF